MQHKETRSQRNRAAWRSPAALLWGICCYLPGCVITALGGAAAGSGEAQMVLSGRNHTFEADKASQATLCSAIGGIFRNYNKPEIITNQAGEPGAPYCNF